MSNGHIDETITYLLAQIDKMQRAVDALQAVKAGLEAGEADKVPASPRPKHREIVQHILDEARRPLFAGEIAKIAHKGKLIPSSVGYRGVYSAVYSTLVRQKNIFVRLTNGRWDLRARRVQVQANIKLMETATKMVTNAVAQMTSGKSEPKADEKKETAVH